MLFVVVLRLYCHVHKFSEKRSNRIILIGVWNGVLQAAKKTSEPSTDAKKEADELALGISFVSFVLRNSVVSRALFVYIVYPAQREMHF